MRVTEFKLEHYRNIESACLRPGRELTVLCGDNGQGKTNLLEAIWLLTGAKSFRGSRDGELIRLGQPFAVLEGITCSREGGEPLENDIRITIGSKESERPGRRAKLNGVDKGRAAALAGVFTAVVFDPSHLNLIKGSPAGRRRFLDGALCQLYPGYLTASRRYLRAVAQKNALLKGWEYTAGSKELLAALNEELAQQGEFIQKKRLDYMQGFAPLAAANYREISGGREQLQLRYQPQFAPGGFRAALREAFARERAAGFCLCGPHREDFEVLLQGQPARTFASQGQQRSAALSMKLAEAAWAEQITGEHPVMMLDDVLSELDEGRRRYLLTRMERRQTLVTTCDDRGLLNTAGAVFRMQGGVLTQL